MNNNIEINQVLAQMRVMAAQAQNKQAAPQAQEAGFGDMLKQSINEVNRLQQASSDIKTAFDTGSKDVNLAQVMIAAQKSSLSFEAMVQVRNKLVEAYKEVMNMPI